VAGITPGADCAAVRLRQVGSDRAQTLLTPFDRLTPLLANPCPRAVRPRRWLHELDRALLEMHPFGSFHAAARAPIRLLPFQLEPALAVLRDGATRVLVADGVGLGKTIQAGLLLLELAERQESFRALVLAPAGLRAQWLAELSARFGLTALLADTAWLRSLAAERPADVNPWSLPGIYIASHDLVKRPEVLRPLEDVAWDAVVVDEAHAATSGTDRRMAIQAIAARSLHVMLLTATPHGGNRHELDALCRIGSHHGDHGEHDPIMLFQRSRADIGEGRPRKTTVLTVMPSAAERRMHDLLERYSARVWQEAGRRGDERARLVSIVLRKRALSSAASLAASVERRLALLGGCRQDPWQLSLPLAAVADEDPLEDDEPVAALAVPGLADPRLERRHLTAIGDAARRAASDERKTRFLLRLLARLREPAIVFTEYRDTLARLEGHVTAAGHAVSVLHGGMTPAERSRVQHAFNHGGGTLLATDAASEGLNLHQRCRVIVHYELPWNPSRLEQRAGRVDRLGQTRRVHELVLVAAHTAERLVVAPLITRFAATTTARGRMLEALTESRVAWAVMTHAEPARVVVDDCAALPELAVRPPQDLQASAAGEAARLQHCRSLAARSSQVRGAVARGRAVVATLDPRARMPPGLFLVLATTVLGGDGSLLHAEPRLVRVDLRDRCARLDTGRLRELVEALARAGADALWPRGDREPRDLLDLITAREQARLERQRRREQAIARTSAAGYPSAARQLVQAGLFDRRALRAAARDAASADSLRRDLSERAARASATSPSVSRIELIAALLVPGRS
jgi:superfamily II DNA or RNA helicase